MSKVYLLPGQFFVPTRTEFKRLRLERKKARIKQRKADRKVAEMAATGSERLNPKED